MTPAQIAALLPPLRPFNWTVPGYKRTDLLNLGIFSIEEIASASSEEILAKLEQHHDHMVRAGREGAHWRCNSRLIALKIAIANERKARNGDHLCSAR